MTDRCLSRQSHSADDAAEDEAAFAAPTPTPLAEELLFDQLGQALRTRSLEVRYQRIVNTVTGRITAVEALARMSASVGGSAHVEHIERAIALAERHGLIDQLFGQLCALALPQLRRWRDAGFALDLCVNVSRVQLEIPGWAESWQAIVAAHRLSPADLIVEITESRAASASWVERDNLTRLAAAGYRLAIDDFGSGYANLGTIAEGNWHSVKLDRAMVVRLRNEATFGLELAGLVALFKRRGLQVVAEGVEDRTLAALVAESGVDTMQGFHFGRPEDADTLTATLLSMPDEIL